jgi:SPP1 gp7 family putative phage head morphogenesis protein
MPAPPKTPIRSKPLDILRVLPEEAIKAAKARGVVPPDAYYAELQTLARSLAFSVAGIASRDQLQAVLDSLVASMAEGIPFDEWKKRAVRAGTLPLDMPDHRIANIFRTNMVGQYMRGRCQGIKANANTHPYLRYSATQDARVRPGHLAMHGFSAHVDDRVWKTWMPPCGYQCRCTVIPMTEAQYWRAVERDEKRLAGEPEAAQARALALLEGPDSGWDYNVCEEPDAGVLRALAMAKQRWSPGLQPPPGPAIPTPPPPVAPQKPPHFFTSDPDRLDMEARGRAILDELLDGLVMPDDRTITPMMSMRGQPVKDYLAAGVHVAYKKAASDYLQTKLMEKLKSLRSFGGATYHITPDPASFDVQDIPQYLQKAASVYPTSWIEASNRAGTVHAQFSMGRAWAWTNKYYGPYPASRLDRWDQLSAVVVQDMEGATLVSRSHSTNIHELGHRLQSVMPKLDEPFQEAHRARTAGEPLERLNQIYPNSTYADSEMARRDQYINAYFGKEYRNGAASEMLTMIFQAILSEDGYGRTMLSEMLGQTRDLLELGIGLLAHYRP